MALGRPKKQFSRIFENSRPPDCRQPRRGTSGWPAAADTAAENRPQSRGESLRSPEGEILPQKRQRATERLQRKNSGMCRPVAKRHGQARADSGAVSPQRAAAERTGENRAQRAGAGPDSHEGKILPPRQERTPERPQRENSATCRPTADRWRPPPKIPHLGATRAAPTARAGDFAPTAPKDLSVAAGQEFGHVRQHAPEHRQQVASNSAKGTATGNAGTDRSLAKIAHTATERVSGVPKGKFCLRSREGPQRGPSARIWARPERRHDEAVGAGTCRVRTTCLSCGEAVHSAAAAVVNDLPEDDGEERILVVHDGCQGALVRGSLRRSASVPEPRSCAAGATERACSAADEHGPSGAPRDTGAALPQPAGNLSNVHPAARCRPTAKTRRPPRPDRTPPRISAPRGPGQPCRFPTRKTPPEGPEAVSLAPARNPTMCTSRPPITKATTINGEDREAKG